MSARDLEFIAVHDYNFNLNILGRLISNEKFKVNEAKIPMYCLELCFFVRHVLFRKVFVIIPKL